MKSFKRLKERTVILRVDLNSPLKQGKIVVTERLRRAAQSIKQLLRMKARVVVISHQGRPGQADCVSLRQHAQALRKFGIKVRFVDEVAGKRALRAIQQLKSGEAVLLENVRFMREEMQELSPKEQAKVEWVSKLARLADAYVNDAFSASHRSHASLVGFPQLLPSYVGPELVKELRALSKFQRARQPCVLVLGGAKIKECLDLMEKFLEKKKTQRVLTGGLLAEVLCVARGIEIGERNLRVLEAKGCMELEGRCYDLLKRWANRIEVPLDFAVQKDGQRVELKIEELPTQYLIKDLGYQTIQKYKKIIKGARSVLFKGPLGIYEEPGFEVATEEMLKAIAASKAYSVVGGGDTVAALEQLKIPFSSFNHVSLAGGAFVEYLSGKALPALQALRTA